MDDQSRKDYQACESTDLVHTVRLRAYQKRKFDRGRSKVFEILWILLDTVFVRSRLPGSAHRRLILRTFGARIGERVVLKPGIRIKFPWRIEIGDDSWIGEEVWIDNLAPVCIGSNCCLSQGVYIGTGSHDWSASTFDLILKPVKIEDGAWIASKSVIAPGVLVGEGAVLALGSVATSDLMPWAIYQGVPATLVKKHRMVAARDPEER